MNIFRELDLGKIIRNQEAKMYSRIDKYSNDEIMANDLDILAENCFEEFKISTVQIGEENYDRRSISQTKIRTQSYSGNHQIDIESIEHQFHFPFIGDPILFRCSASTMSLSPYPEIELIDGHICFTYTVRLTEMNPPEEARDKLVRRLTKELDDVKSGLSFANKDVEVYNSHIKIKAIHALNERKKNVERYFAVSKAFEVPIKKSADATMVIPMQRRILPIAKTFDKEQSWCIQDSEYQFILTSLKHIGSTQERAPAAYRSMHEEDLRQTVLAGLNTLYTGGATAETFRNKGKTDICIEMENRAAFIAECKMWSGSAVIEQSVIQLDGYSTWRDCKVALIFFSRNKDFLSVLTSAKKAISEITWCKQYKEIDKNEFECFFTSTNNPGQLLKIRIMIFNLYTDHPK